MQRRLLLLLRASLGTRARHRRCDQTTGSRSRYVSPTCLASVARGGGEIRVSSVADPPIVPCCLCCRRKKKRTCAWIIHARFDSMPHIYIISVTPLAWMRDVVQLGYSISYLTSSIADVSIERDWVSVRMGQGTWPRRALVRHGTMPWASFVWTADTRGSVASRRQMIST
ncbi:hypothetical protein V8E55_009757 [Tylopilus felleus]